LAATGEKESERGAGGRQLGTDRAGRRTVRFHDGGRLHPGRPAKSPAPGFPVVRKLEERRIVLPALLGEGQPAAVSLGKRPGRQDVEHSLDFWRRPPRWGRAGLRRLDAAHSPDGWAGAHGPDDAGGERGGRAGRLAGPYRRGKRSLRQTGAQGFDELSGAAQ